jgi:hypothetical protein
MGNYVTVYADVECHVDVDDVVSEADDQTLVDTLSARGYNCVKGTDDLGFDYEDWEFLIKLIDNTPQTWYTRRVRDKLIQARYN